jgi:aspartyl-tRNA synthetase
MARPANMANPQLRSGKVEVTVSDVDILNPSETPPFEIEERIATNEELRLKHRYLDLRRPPMQRSLIARHRIVKTIRDYFDAEGFLEIETPILTKSTPEGARDYLVPSRVQRGMFFALPQSPQLFKQLLMIAGYDRYFQIARCFRDEDLRKDRQPEFTQLDVEMSFVQTDDVMRLIEGCLRKIMHSVHGVEIPIPFPRMTYQQAMSEYGIDRPDTRYDLRLRDVSAAAGRTDFKVFTDALARKGVVRALRLPGGGDLPRKDLDDLTEKMKGIGAGGLPYVKVVKGDDGHAKFETGAAKFFGPEATAQTCAATNAEPGDLLFFAAGAEADVCKYLAWLREVVALKRNLIPAGKWNFLWVVDFPMFEFHEDDGRYYAVHHPFTAPRDDDVPLLESDPRRCRAKAYDVVLNGVELGGGSIRIHRADVQQQVFRLLNLGPEEQRAKVGFLLDALRYGAPPHGGIALGIDRMVMLLLGLDSIRDTFSFPKTQLATCPMTNAPSPVAAEQLEELGIRVVPQAK